MYLGDGMKIHMRKYGSLGLYCDSFNSIQEFKQPDTITSQRGSLIFHMYSKFMSFAYIGFPPSVAQQPVYYMQENTRNVALDFGFLSTTFAKPVFTSWNVSSGKLIHAEPPVLMNSSVLVFDKVTREHDGVYTLTNMYCSLNVCNTISWTLTLSVQCKQI